MRAIVLLDRVGRMLSGVTRQEAPAAGGARLSQQKPLAVPKPYKKDSRLIVGYGGTKEPARKVARARSTELVVHRKDGLISERSTYGRDAAPARNK